LCLIVALAAVFCFRRGYILYWGDAQAHLDNSRMIIDSRTPGYDQLGTVWLPVLHAICLPFVGNDWLWTTGLAGTIPVAICFVIAGACFYYAAKYAYASSAAALVVLAAFVLNPNILYLASIPMTEIVFFAGLGAALLALFRFRATQNWWFIVLGIIASWWMSLTRYDGWFLIPFLAAAFAIFARRRRIAVFLAISALASLAPIWWLGHNFWETGNALDFYNGPYSAAVIQGSRWYPGYHDWLAALHYYAKAGQLCAGWPLIVLGVAGAICAILRKRAAGVLFLLLTPAFYIWSIHSSKTPIFVPQLWPHSYYNTRYGIAVVAVAAFALGGIVTATPPKWRKFAWLIPVIAVVPWLSHPSPQESVCWKESQINSVSRRAWTEAAAQFLTTHDHLGQGVLAPFGDVTGIFCRAGIPIAEMLHDSNLEDWLPSISRPDLAHETVWAVAQQGDRLSQALARSPRVYMPVKEIRVAGAPTLIIYRRRIAPINR
jgi:hypothetical protein